MNNHEEINQLIDKLKSEIKEEGCLFEERVVFKEPKNTMPNEPWNMDPHLHYFIPLTSHIKIIGKLVTFVKRVIRKMMRFLIVPVVDEQTRFNISTVDEVNKLKRQVEEQEALLQQIKNKINMDY